MSPTQLDHLRDLTRRYARFATRGGGLDWVAGGLLLAALGGLCSGWTLGLFLRSGQAWGWANYFRFFPRHAPLPVPLAIRLAALLIPLLWLAVRFAIRRHVHQRFGSAVERPSERTRLRLAQNRLGTAIMAGVFVLIFLDAARDHGIALAQVGVAALLLAISILASWTALGEVDRSITGCLFLFGALLWGGMGAGTVIHAALAFSLIGILLAGAGAIQQLRFHALAQELEALGEPS